MPEKEFNCRKVSSVKKSLNFNGVTSLHQIQIHNHII